MPELFGTRVRYSGASLGANVAAALSGGFSPIIATALLVWADASWGISLYIIALSLLSAVAVLATPETARVPLKA
jgi:MFS transporter, MHS family, shikimate and dehydroshikimate transport protein